MRITAAHSTLYKYEFPVALNPHTFRLRPRANSAQRLIAFDIEIVPAPIGTTECLDQDGNLALNAWFDATTRELSIRTRFTVETLLENPFDYVLSGDSIHLPMVYPEPLRAALWPYRNNGNVGKDVRHYAESTASGAQWNSLSFLAALNRRIFQTCRSTVRPDGQAWPSDRTLTLREGSCRDLAVLFCDSCRVVGLAARFVSGYECVPSSGPDSYMHAWAEVYLPGVGWRGYDPSRGLAVSNGHIAVAAGFDPELAAPVAGWYSGGANSNIEASLTLEIVTGDRLADGG
jgi:transglutaminase-like putative cysteine protease